MGFITFHRGSIHSDAGLSLQAEQKPSIANLQLHRKNIGPHITESCQTILSYVSNLFRSVPKSSCFDSDSPFGIVQGWSEISAQQASQILKSYPTTQDPHLVPLSFYNKTLERRCHIQLTGTVVPKFKNHVRDPLIDDFLAQMPLCTRQSVKLADPMAYINLVFPPEVCPESIRYVAGCFWTWLCIVDDLTEDGDAESSLETCVKVLSQSPYTPMENSQSACLQVMAAFQKAVCKTQLDVKPSAESAVIVDDWKTVFWEEVSIVCKALLNEQPFLEQDLCMQDWLALRIVTISARPFFVLFRAGLGLPLHLNSSLGSADNSLIKMQFIMQSILGLQNDIIGWEKDHKAGHKFNAVEILVNKGILPVQAFDKVLSSHNDLMKLFVSLRKQYMKDIIHSRQESLTELQNLELITNFGHAMVQWMVGCGRYLPDPANTEA
jgi:hypothetical protein